MKKTILTSLVLIMVSVFFVTKEVESIDSQSNLNSVYLKRNAAYAKYVISENKKHEEAIKKNSSEDVIVKESNKKHKPPISEPKSLEDTKFITTYEDINFETITIKDSNILKNNGVVTQNGEYGNREVKIKIDYVDNVEVSRTIISDVIVKKPINKVITVGTKVEETVVTPQPVINDNQINIMFNAINQDRASLGLNKVNFNNNLIVAAKVRGSEIIQSFSHTRPSGEAFWTVSELAYAENIAYGSSDGQLSHERFMASPEHKASILTGEYKTVGISSQIANDGRTYWVVLFGY